MREQEFREWLEADGKSAGTVSSQVSKVRKLDRFFGDLDAHIANGTIDQVVDAIADPASAPTELGKGDRWHLPTSLRYYRRFAAHGAPHEVLDSTPIWFVTARWGEEDGTDRFVSRGDWSLLRDSGSPANRRMREMQPGDRIVLRHKYQQTHDLPFDANGKPVSVMKIRAIGTITEQREDGVSVGVDWEALAKPLHWYFYNHTEAVWRLRDPGENESADQLRRFILDGEPQDFEWFLNNPYWRDRLFGAAGSILARFDRSALFRDGRAGWSPDQTAAFCNIAQAVHDAGLDWWFVDMARGPVRFGRKSPGRRHAEGVMGYLSVTPAWVSFNPRGLEALDLDEFAIDPAEADGLAETLAEKAELIAAWKAPQPPRAGLWPDEGVREEDGPEEQMTDMPDPTNLILYGPPGTGKTYSTMVRAVELCGEEPAADRALLRQQYEALRAAGRIEFVTFHQNFAYEEFVEGLRPDAAEDGNGGLRLTAQAGVFHQIAEAASRSGVGHVLIIDEINRANISRVFGELITLIEPDKRLGMPNALTVRLPYSRREFGVPANLHIVGTMNTADRSIALLDTALRRRFRFEELAPRADLLEDVDGVPLGRLLATINQRLEYLLDRDHAIGHAFFMGEGGSSRAAIDDTMRFTVIPLLQEYFFEDWSRIHAVLGGGFISGTVLTPPPGFDGQGERRSWSVRQPFAADAYATLLSKGQAVERVPSYDEEEEAEDAGA